MVYRHLINFWPLVPAIDLQSVTSPYDYDSRADEPFFLNQSKYLEFQFDSDPAVTGKDQLNCLIIGDGIGCLIKTIARMYRHGCTNLNIYYVTTFSESLARSLLFLSLFGDVSLKLSLLERAETFLEILGNIHVRCKTKLFVEEKSTEIIKWYMSQKEDFIPNVSLSHLKQKELDSLLRVFEYLKNETEPFTIGKGWENALRSFYSNRYDSRRNWFDYHFNLKLTDYRIISLRKYIDWGETGIAFRFRQAKYNFPNKTMHVFAPDSLVESDIDNEYVGDIVTSPYVVFGVETGNESMLKKVNDQYTSNSEDISKFNVIDMANEFLSHVRKQDTTKNVKVYPLVFETFCKMKQFINHFDVAYVTCDMMPRVQSLLTSVLKDNGIVVFETINNVVNSTKEQKDMYCKAIDRLAYSSGLEDLELESLSGNENFKVFIVKESSFEDKSEIHNVSTE